MAKDDFGTHTIELYAKNLKYTEVQKIIDSQMEHGKIHIVKRDFYNIDRHFKSTYLVNSGIRMRIHQSHDKSSGIGFIINPSTLLSGKYQPVRLWKPTKEAVNMLLIQLDFILGSIGLERIAADDLSLSQMDLTEDNWYDKHQDLTSIIRNYHKCFIPRHFKVVNSDDKEIRKRLFVMRNDIVTVKVYDKIYELKKYGRCPKSLEDENILRYEVSLKREAFLKKFGLDREAPLYEMLLAGYEHGEELLADYHRKMFPFSGKIVRYEKAHKRIESDIADALLKEQMLYLLRKTSDSAGLSAAVRKIENYYKDVDNRRVKKIFSAFDNLGIAPITHPND